MPADGGGERLLFEGVGVPAPGERIRLHLVRRQVFAQRIQVAGTDDAVFAGKTGAALIEGFVADAPQHVLTHERRCRHQWQSPLSSLLGTSPPLGLLSQ